jgi:hypothetical protein
MTRTDELTGKFTPFVNEQPYLVTFAQQRANWVLVFSTPEKLREEMERNKIANYKIKHIDDGTDFANSLFEHGIRIMADPYVIFDDKGQPKTRYKEYINVNVN